MGLIWYAIKIRMVVLFFRIIQWLAPGNCILHIHARTHYQVNSEKVKNPTVSIPSKWIYEYEGGKRISRMAPSKNDMMYGISFFI